MPDNPHHDLVLDQSTPARNISAEVASPSRRSALLMGAAICGAALLWRPGSARAALHYHDVNAVRFLEEVEELQKEFFTRAALAESATVLSVREREVIRTIARQDREHTGWFSLARDKFDVAKFSGLYTPNASQSRPPRIFTLPVELFSNREKLLAAAIMMKETAVGAYHSQILRTREPRLMQALASLAGVEGRHAAALHEISEDNYRPDAMEIAISAAQVTTRLRHYGFHGETML